MIVFHPWRTADKETAARAFKGLPPFASVHSHIVFEGLIPSASTFTDCAFKVSQTFASARWARQHNICFRGPARPHDSAPTKCCLRGAGYPPLQQVLPMDSCLCSINLRRNGNVAAKLACKRLDTPRLSKCRTWDLFLTQLDQDGW